MIDTFLHNIAWLRKHYGLSKKEMAEKLEIGVPSLNKIEQGELPPRLSCDILFCIHKQFGIGVAELLCQRLEDNEKNIGNFFE